MNIEKKNERRWIALTIVISMLVLIPSVQAEAIIIDHNCANLSQIPDEWIDTVQDNIKLHYAHTSHGGQLTTGLQRIENADPDYSQARGSTYLPTEAGALCIFDGQEHDTYITPSEYWDSLAGRNDTQDVIDHNPTINVSMWSWCCQLTSYSEEHVQTYLDVINAFETANPDVTFIYMTCNAQATGSSGYNRYLRNEQIRSWVSDHPEANRVLFDFADLDSWWYNSTTGEWEHATYDYSGVDVPAEHTEFHGSEAGHTTYESCEQKGRAVWWMLARIADWNGQYDSTIYVNTSGWWIVPTQFNASSTPIQSAINNATDDNLIYVYNGSYFENVIVNKSLTLQGEDRDVVTVQANDSSDHVVVVTVNRVNISGFTLTGATSHAKAGIYLDGVNTGNITDITAAENYNGIYLSSSSNNILLKNIVVNNSNEGVCLWHSSDNSITNNLINSNTQSNIWMRYSDNNTLTENIVKRSQNGIRMYDSSNNSITDSIANSNNCGIYLYNSFNNRLINNTASENYDGIYLNWGNDNNTVTNNTLVNNTNGLEVRVSCNNTIANNNCSNNTKYGIYLWASSHNNTLTNNTANSNEKHMGIYLYDSDNNRLIRNTANYNDWEGIRLYYSDNCLIESNEVSYNFNLTGDTGTGVLLWTSSNAIITNNTAGHNMYGIYIHDAAYNNTVINNTASENDVHGIVVYRSSDVLVCNNTANNNDYHGIFLGDSPTENITIRNNTASHNIHHGIFSTLYYTAAAPANLAITGNTLVDNGIGDYLGYGIYLKESSGVVISDNYIADNAAFSYAYGIKLYSFTNAAIINNSIVNNSDYGIMLDSVSGSGMMPGFAGVTAADGRALQPMGSGDNAAPPTALALLGEDYDSGMLPQRSCLSDMDSSPDGVNVSENLIVDNAGGIWLNNSDNVTITGNNVTNSVIGINLTSSNGNTVFNNCFNNTNNAWDDGTNVWNITPIQGTNIIGGSWRGGNYWDDYAGEDTDGDGLGDTLLPYNSSGSIQQGGDWHPLTEVATLLSNLEITGTWVCWSDNCTICYNVTNTGNGTASAGYNTTLFVDNVEVAHDCVPEELTPGEKYTGCFDNYTWTYTPPEDNITVCADFNDTVSESNETNNCGTKTWMCGDMNMDGTVTPADSGKAFNRYLNSNYPLELPWAADVNCDGTVTPADSGKVFNHYLDSSYELECCCGQG